MIIIYHSQKEGYNQYAKPIRHTGFRNQGLQNSLVLLTNLMLIDILRFITSFYDAPWRPYFKCLRLAIEIGQSAQLLTFNSESDQAQIAQVEIAHDKNLQAK